MANLTLYHVSVCVEPGTGKPPFYPARWSVYFLTFWELGSVWSFWWRRIILLAPDTGLKRWLNVAFEMFLECCCRLTSYSFQIFSRQVPHGFRAASQQLGCLVNPEGATNILVQDFPPHPSKEEHLLLSMLLISMAGFQLLFQRGARQ